MAYKAPEICMGHAATVACDIWSFGVVLNEITTGESPHRRGDYRLPVWASGLKLLSFCA